MVRLLVIADKAQRPVSRSLFVGVCHCGTTTTSRSRYVLARYTVVNTQAVGSAQCQLLGVLGGLVLEVETLAKDY